jgi:hypothetical protein
VSASLAALDAIGFRACASLCERGVRLTARAGLHGEASEVRVRAPLSTTGEPWGYGAGDLATAASLVAYRLGHLDLVDQITRERRALQTADTIPPATQETV